MSLSTVKTLILLFSNFIVGMVFQEENVSLSEQRKKQFLIKKKRLIDQAIQKQGGSKKIFEHFTSSPTEGQLLDFLVEANYGDCNENPLSLLGESVGGEVLTDLLTHGLKSTLKRIPAIVESSWFETTEDTPYSEFLRKNFIGAGCTYTELVYFYVTVSIESRVLPIVEENFISSLIDNPESNKGYSISPESGLAALGHYGGLIDPSEVEVTPLLSPLALRSDRLLCFSLYIALPSTLEHLDYLAGISRENHDVIGHDRQLSSGRVVKVSPHNRKNPLRRSTALDPEKEDNYIVYFVYDSDLNLRYVGEGRPDRPNHVNSGASHNPRINEHFYTRGPMAIRLLHSNLTKDYAKAIESHYIKKFGSQLWNSAENTLFETECKKASWDQYKLNLPVLEVFDEGTEYERLLKMHD